MGFAQANSLQEAMTIALNYTQSQMTEKNVKKTIRDNLYYIPSVRTGYIANEESRTRKADVLAETADRYWLEALFTFHFLYWEEHKLLGIVMMPPESVNEKWPNVYNEYRKRCTKDMLGTYHMVKVEPHLYVANIFGQLSYGTEKRQTNYVALACAIFQLMKDMPHCTIRIPYRMGCGLAGGDWDKVLNIITDSAHTWNSNVEIWQFNK